MAQTNRMDFNQSIGGTMEKSWVIIKYSKHPQNAEENRIGKIDIWRDYNNSWGSSLYEVLDYYDGSYNQAKKYSKTIIEGN